MFLICALYCSLHIRRMVGALLIFSCPKADFRDEVWWTIGATHYVTCGALIFLFLRRPLGNRRSISSDENVMSSSNLRPFCAKL